MVTQEAEIRGMILKYVKSLKKEISIERVILYGSYAKGTATDDSDIDVAIESKDFGDNYLKEWQRLYRHVWKSGVDPSLEPRPLYHDIHPSMKEEILESGKTIYEAKHDAVITNRFN
ncbi:nucleotidyltransferase family protein [Salicibibacter kimchii]|uniref:Nucleotidyltransferase domain-containing protein n=1 Tax=Salicibibacter kimchii TaxID=2099786 RepID=A0A345C3T0_9BACI|nr:nucleotidyltransferase domain-containing protein [Salicibibacter kimchii]AXF57861.1 nucleotidyltransferase domain-containing protein [Salicibibacter kimchii]